MTDENKDKPAEKPKIVVVDRRHSMNAEDDTGEETANVEERYPNYVEQLRREAEDKDKRLREYIAAYKEKSAENDEFRARLARDNDNRLEQFKANLFSRLVPILDNLKRAAGAAQNSGDFDSLKEGIELVVQQYARELEDNGVEVIQAVGEKFDPKIHEAFLTVDTQDAGQDNVVIEELEPGYLFKDKLIKAAKVKVARLVS